MVSSTAGNQHKTFKQITRERLLFEMLRSTKTGDSKSTWKVLIMDKFTIKIISSACKMTDIIEEGISLVEDLCKQRQPFPSMDAIYFIQPCEENVTKLLSDMGGKSPLYRRALVFFSSPIAVEVLNHLKSYPTVLRRIMLKEMNLEYFAIDRQGFITGNERALEDLFADDERACKLDACLNEMAARIATVFASLKEFPSVRFRAAKFLEAPVMATYSDLIPTKLAAGIWNCLAKYKRTIRDFPQKETCELLILDRSIDQIAPIIHEWFYDAMCHDLLHVEGNKFVHEVPSKTGGPPETKEFLLEEHDPIWLEIRHEHIADASERLHGKITDFTMKNKTAQILCSRGGGELSTRDLRQMSQTIPQYSEQIDILSLHVEIAGQIHRYIEHLGLKEIGQLEQDLVFGYAGREDIIKFLKKENSTQENKLRVLMILSAIYPEMLEDEKGLELMKLAKLSAEDMKAVSYMKLLGGSPETPLDSAKSNSTRTFFLKSGKQKKYRVTRKERIDAEETWKLSRFYPILEELIENLSKGELSHSDYPCINGSNATSVNGAPACSVRTRPSWALRRNCGYDHSSTDSLPGSSTSRMGQRIFVFIAGGATRSELRVCHKLTSKLKREIVLGSTSLDDPQQFIMKLKRLSAHELALDDLHI